MVSPDSKDITRKFQEYFTEVKDPRNAGHLWLHHYQGFVCVATGLTADGIIKITLLNK